MDRREQLDDPVEALRTALDGRQAEIWTALPGIVAAFDPDAMTVSVQPAVKGTIVGEDGTARQVPLPLLVDVPVCFPQGGGFIFTFPIKPGDECLVVIASRCIDSWWQSGGVQAPAERRMHDLSDGFALVGPRSQPRRLAPGVDPEAVQLRSEDGADYVEMAPGGKVRIEALDIETHARRSHSWDIDGFGQRITSLGGGAYEIHTWQEGAVVTPVSGPIAPPEGP